MKINSENGLAVTDIAIAIVVIFIFATIISVVVYNYNSASEEINLKSEAMQFAIQEIENMKNKTIDELETEDATYRSLREIEGKEGFWREIIVEDYADIKTGAERNLVKKVTVKIEYRFKKEIEDVELSTIISKET